MESNFPLKAARMRAKASLVQVAALAGCSINTAQRYEVAPESVRADKRDALAVVYKRFPQVLDGRAA